MVGFGMSKKPAIEDCYGASSKENQHVQPSRAAPPSTDDPLHASGKANMRDYVDSMDTAFPAGARSHAKADGKLPVLCVSMCSGVPYCTAN